MSVDYHGLRDMMESQFEQGKETIVIIDSYEKIIITEKIDFSKLLKQLYRKFKIPIEILEEDNCYKTKRFVFKHSLHFVNVVFKEEVLFNNIKFVGKDNQEFHMEHVVFEKKVSYDYSIFHSTCFFESVTFQDLGFAMAECMNDITFANTDFEGDVNFNRSKFNGRADFLLVNFSKKIIFLNITFNKGYFYHNTFIETVDFYETIIIEELSFSHTQFNSIASFNKTTLSETLKFNNIKLNKGSDIYFADSNRDHARDSVNSKISIINTVINNSINFYSDLIEIIDFSGSVIAGSGTLNMISFDPKCANYQTATILKNEEIKRNNIIKALEYKAEEQDLYTIYLRTKHADIKEKPKDSINKIWQTRFEQLSIWLSKKSNNHGQNWGKAFFFTLGIGFLFFTSFYLVLLCIMPISSKEIIALFNISFAEHINNFLPILSDPAITGAKAFNVKLNMFFSEFFKYLIPVDYTLLLKYLNNAEVFYGIKYLGALIYFFGKILIAYGVVQTVNAFRKFNKTN